MGRVLTLREFLLRYPSPYPPESRASYERATRLAIPCAEMEVTDGSEGAESETEITQTSAKEAKTLWPLPIEEPAS